MLDQMEIKKIKTGDMVEIQTHNGLATIKVLRET